MLLSFNLEYFGKCSNVINFYSNIFDNAEVNVKKYKEMPMAAAFNIKGQGLDMVWQSTLTINLGNNILCLEMSDSILIAMQSEMSFNKLLYNPLICITHNDESYLRNLFSLLYENQYKFEELLNGTIPDRNGIRWTCQKSNECGIYYCLEFDGFCNDVIDYYENAFNIKATEVVRYEDIPYNEEISIVGKEKICKAMMRFQNGKQICVLKLSDSIESAIKGLYGYDPRALLFYQNKYNPIVTLKDSNVEYLSNSFNKLMSDSKLNRHFLPDDEDVLRGSLIDKYGICWNIIHNKI